MAEQSIVVIGFEVRQNQKGENEEYVIYAPRFAEQSSQIPMRIRDIHPDNLRNVGSPNQKDMKRAFFENRWRQIEPAYKAWKEGNDVPLHGTPLTVMPGITEPMAKVLRGVGFKTVEDIAEAHDGAIGKIPLPNTRGLKKQAMDFLEARKEGATAAEVANLKAQLEEAVAMIGELKADKPKRGRPPKAKEDEIETEDAA